METKFPDLALVDVGLPDGSGLELVRRVREADGVASRVDPATADRSCSAGRRGELDRMRGFERGCDDYVGQAVLLRGAARPRRRAAAPRAAPPGRRGGSGSGRSSVDPRRARSPCAASGSSCRRRSSRCCARSPPSPRGCSRRRSCCAGVWGFRALGATRTLDSHACRLRQKLGVHGERYVVNVWGVGYRLVDGPVAA